MFQRRWVHALVLSGLLAQACSWSSPSARVEDGKLLLWPKSFQVTAISEEEKELGRKDNETATVTGSLLVTIRYPLLALPQKGERSAALQGDAWALRVQRNQDLLQNAIVPIAADENMVLGTPVQEFTVKVTYSYFYLSADRKRAPCAIADVVYRVNEWHTGERTDVTIPSEGRYGIFEHESFPGNLRAARASVFRAIEVNGGERLQGEYRFDVALMNSKSGQILTNYHPIPQTLVVTSEQAVVPPGCTGFNQEQLDRLYRSSTGEPDALRYFQMDRMGR